jgi:hypothetical protein
MRKIAGKGAVFLALVCVLASCEMYGYGKLGGADRTETVYPGDPVFEQILGEMSGVWYSRYAGIGRLDGYRIGKMRDFETLVEDSGKAALFPELPSPPETYGRNPFTGEDYFVLYDDTVYGQADDGSTGQGSWDFAYTGIVRAVNLFYGNPRRGAIIIEYLRGCAPRWDSDLKDGRRPFFGVYYRVLDRDTVQMANAVDLAALYAGKKYYTERETLDEAIAFNSVENEAEFISWGVVIPQEREK